MPQERACDVLIIGAGLAGGLMARLLRLEQPDLKIIAIERRAEFDYWIGESTVEVFTDYAERVLKLGPYLMKHAMLKNGLRFFFDSPDKDTKLCEMSEVGRARYPGNGPSYQLDRATFDRDIAEMNQALGVEVLLDTKLVRDGSDPIMIDGERGHLVQTTAGLIRCQWLIDAAGRSSPLSAKFKLVPKDPRHPVDAAWGRYKNIRLMDFLGDRAWRARVDNTQRCISTNHLMYRGYWIWTIPLTHDIYSIGVSYNREMLPVKLRSAEELTDWFRSHKCLEELLGPETEVLDFLSFRDCARCAETQFSEDRWFLTGMSGVVIDALYSQTGAYNSYSNRLINELIKTDRSGDTARFRAQLKHFNIFMRMKYEGLLASLKYHRFGSYDAFIGWRSATQNTYFNREIPQGATDLSEVIGTADEHQTGCGCSFETKLADWKRASVQAAFHRLVDEFIEALDRTGHYYALNRNHFSECTERFAVRNKMCLAYRAYDLEEQEDHISYESCFRYFVGRVLQIEGRPFDEATFLSVFSKDWKSHQTLAQVLEAMRLVNPSEATGPKLTWLPKGPVDEATRQSQPWYCRLTPPTPDPALVMNPPRAEPVHGPTPSDKPAKLAC